MGEAIFEWFKMARDKNVPITREKALYLAESLGYKDFIASVGWLDKFMKKHNIILKNNER